MLAAAALLAAGCAGRARTGQAPVAWRTALFDYERTNATTGELAPPLSRSWYKDLSAFRLYDRTAPSESASPAISDGKIYVGTAAGSFYSIELDSGRVEWREKAGAPIDGAATTDGRMVCFGASDGLLRCLERSTGEELWRYQARSEIVSSPLIVEEKVYFASSDDRLTALSASNGEKLWSYSRGTYKTVTPRMTGSPAYYQGRIYHVFSDGSLVCLSGATGKVVWSREVAAGLAAGPSGATRRSPLVYGGAVYVIGAKETVLAFGALKGEVRGRYTVTEPRDIIVTGKGSIVIAGAAEVVSFERGTGRVLWKTRLKHAPVGSVFASPGYLYVLSNHKRPHLGLDLLSTTNGFISALRLSDGHVAWTKRLISTTGSNAAASGGGAALLDNDGLLEVFVATD